MQHILLHARLLQVPPLHATSLGGSKFSGNELLYTCAMSVFAQHANHMTSLNVQSASCQPLREATSLRTVSTTLLVTLSVGTLQKHIARTQAQQYHYLY